VPGGGDAFTGVSLADEELLSGSLVCSGAGFWFCAGVPVVGVIVCTPMLEVFITPTFSISCGL
jgi:hypothetical protein